MRSVITNLTILALSSLVLAACSEAGTAPAPEGVSPAASQASTSAPGVQGKVMETMDSGGYTYVRLRTGDREIWAAGPATAVQVGDDITVIGAMEMKNFHSKTLDRTFESLWFASGLARAGGAAPAGGGAGPPHLSAPSGGGGATAAEPAVAAGSIAKAQDGHTVAELFAKRGDLSAKQISVRGKVVKYNAQIMERNWLHIQDGTGGAGTNDLTVTSSSTASVGDTVLIRGTLALDKDFGGGYKYDVIIEDAQITVED